MNCTDLSRRISVLSGRRDQTLSVLRKAEGDFDRLTEQRKDIEQAQIIIQHVAKLTQDQLQYQVSELTSCALTAIFPRPYSMVVKFEAKRGRTECALLFGLSNGSEIEPMDASGYGPVDVAAFALRLTLLSLQRPQKRRVVVLDEPFKFVSKDLLPRVAELIHELSSKLGIQFVIVTHEDRLIREGDRVFRVKQTDGVSHVTMEGEVVEETPTPVKAEGDYQW